MHYAAHSVCVLDPPNGGWHCWHHDTQLPSNHVIEQHGPQPAGRCAQWIDGAEPCGLLRVHPEPGVGIGVVELWEDGGREDKRVPEVEVAQDGWENSQEESGVTDLGQRDMDELQPAQMLSMGIMKKKKKFSVLYIEIQQIDFAFGNVAQWAVLIERGGQVCFKFTYCMAARVTSGIAREVKTFTES